MERRISWLCVFILIAFMATAAFAAEKSPPKVGTSLPELELLRPDNSVDLKYLGLSSGGKTFKLNQIKAKIAIIQIYSMYCPYCQADAPNINRLYGLIENNPALKDKIKMIGIGAGNTSFEVGTYKRKYAVAFPLIPDEDYKIHKILGEVRTPYFIVAKIAAGGGNEVIYSRLGALENIDLFLAQIVKSAGLK
ncbi:MAG: redoxin [Deltaproteobacteria bacterium HGW-Deltaproteobacteria-12]|jgi:thiol-disulfide isomerase/thioredoxin|nr:MAG: redoxin [Deltaproteobacteria bacterium HGW-Deltaproteobacteria-12]